MLTEEGKENNKSEASGKTALDDTFSITLVLYAAHAAALGYGQQHVPASWL